MARRLALIAHDNKKVDLVAWATFNRKTLAHTARLVRDKVGLEAGELSDLIITALAPHMALVDGAEEAA